ncbi:MAG: M23 family metallopeptidase, partial [Moorea sp. SIO2B7]|nr:M23 family metallopeptidase [Moorena sp. SIO2B7]
DRQALEAAQNQLAKDSDSIGILIRQRVRAQNRRTRRSRRGSGKLIYPHNGRISSYFGWRKHPILKSKRLHSGLDFAGNYGSTIRAADNGIVIFAGWYGGYGNTIVIDHGKGLTTLYGHAKKLYVKERTRVKKGKAIAAVGSSGLSTGPHLHFEVRQNGKPVNPMKYF